MSAVAAPAEIRTVDCSPRLSGRYDLVVVGGGAAGLSAARTGARRKLRTLLIEADRLGGECTFTGCVPSKSLIEAAGRGVTFANARKTMRDAIATIASGENADALTAEGVEVLHARAHFVGPRTLEADGRVISARRVVLATGSAPRIPEIAGLATVEFCTNESVFDLEKLPPSIAVLGGGAIGCELAQAFQRFGSAVTLIEAGERLLAKEERAASAVIAHALEADGVALHLGAQVEHVRDDAGDVVVSLASGREIRAQVLLVAVGRVARSDELNCAAGGVELDERGNVCTDEHLRTTARGVYAIGDVTGEMLFTHAGDEMGRIAVANAFGRLRRRRFDPSVVPWVTFCDPEVARIGPSESDAAGGRARVAVLPMSRVDRAVAAGRTEGFVKLLAAPRPLLGFAGGGRIIGATIVAPRAGEMIHEIALAVRTGVFTGRLAQTVHAYPTWSTAVRQAATQFFFAVDERKARPAMAAGTGDVGHDGGLRKRDGR